MHLLFKNLPLARSNLMHRRSFLKMIMAGAKVAAFTPSHTFTTSTSKRNLHKTIMYSTIGVKNSMLEKFQTIKKTEFEDIEPMGTMNRDKILTTFKETKLQTTSIYDHIH